MELTTETLEDVQGIILSGYGHLNHSAYLFLDFENTVSARQWIRGVIPEVTTGRRWGTHASGERVKSSAVLNIAVTYSGLCVCGLSDDTLKTFPQALIDGPAKRSHILGDTGESAPENWEIGGPGGDSIHAVLMLHAAEEEILAKAVLTQRERLNGTEGGVREIYFQAASRPTSQKNPFGFRDGISNPMIKGTPGHPENTNNVVNTGEFILGHLNSYHLFPPSPAVEAAEPSADLLPSFPDGALPQCRDLGRNGSYLVYRKLDTRVAAFWNYSIEWARTLNDATSDEELQLAAILLASRCFGRWPSGAPMVLSPEYDNPALALENDFTYESDPDGLACSIGSHIRRSNPRASLANNTAAESIKTANRHRILRRALYYGDPLFDLDELDNGVVPLDLKDDGVQRGLQFFSVVSDLKNQFEFVQETWCNNRFFNGLFNNSDPVIGDNDGTSEMTIQASPARKRLLNVPRFVTVCGSEYFFVPSITALEYIAALSGPTPSDESTS